MYVIGTAGHVDHGKSVLVRALTGIDPDRLQEEKDRGMTIDLGFAWLKLPGDQEVSIVDVPGHERFIKNMLAGVGGIDLALLVIAADEGVMPQTREHLAILDLLQLKSGVLVLTKKDLVDGDWLEVVAEDVKDTVRGTALEGSPLVACSAITGEGLDELVSVLEQKLAETPPKRDIGRPRLPIDRAFTIAGFGTVVTGTLIDGSFSVGQEVEVVPGKLRARIRGLQTHRQKVERALPGTRTAANLSGVAADDLLRGQVVALPDSLPPTAALDVRLRAISALRRPIRHNARLSFHSGASEVWGKVRFLDRDELGPGEEGWAQIRLDEPAAVLNGDLFVVRDANDTLGGGQVVEAHGRRHRRYDRRTLDALSSLQEGTPEERLLTLLEQRQPLGQSALVGQLDLPEEESLKLLACLVEAGDVVALGGSPLGDGATLFTRDAFAALGDKAGRAISHYYAEHPLRLVMPKEELRNRLRLPSRLFSAALKRWLEAGKLTETAAGAGLPGHEVKLSAAQQASADAFLRDLDANPYAPKSDSRPDEELLAYLVERGRVFVLGDGVAFSDAAYREMVERTVAHLQQNGRVTLAEVRDMFGTSRKYAQALLEHLDAQKVTQRVGEERVLRQGR
ncbi:MAG: selenocysteine-specific translation elongation factor [Dehalococcoidia bacterium]|nr:selenocysteine-specific translation elongation factor [Dehalococcoidia bacterium]